jgi:hypothetical protein
MFVVKNRTGDFFRGYDCGIMFWGNTDYRIYNTESQAAKVVECINTAPYRYQSDNPQATVEKI